MKTADRENPIHGATWPRNRAHGAVGQNRTRLIEWAEKQEKFQPQEMCFFLTSPFIELTRTYAMKRTHLRYVAFVVAAMGRIKTLGSSLTVKPRLAMNAMMAFSVICSGSKAIVAIPCG